MKHDDLALFLWQFPHRGLQLHRCFFHTRRAAQPPPIDLVQFDLARLTANRIERRVSNGAEEIRRRGAGNLNVATQQPFENLVKRILGGRKRRQKGARVSEQASPVLFVKLSYVVRCHCPVHAFPTLTPEGGRFVW
jgi:hypothetical protein